MSQDSVSPSMHRAALLLQQGRYAEAEKYLREALGEDPNNAMVFYQLAYCQWRQDNEKEALKTIDHAIGLAPFEPECFSLKSLILSSLRRTKEAHAAADEAIGLDPESPQAFCARAAAFCQEMRWKEAETAARAALELDPDNEAAANFLADTLRFQNRLGESRDQIHYMLSRDPEDPDTHASAGWLALQSGDWKKAQTHFLEALRLDADNENAKQGLKEAFKARSILYRTYLQYCFFMQRFTAANQWALIVGFLVVANVGKRIFVGPLAPVGLLVSVLYLLFVLWVHVAPSVGNLQLAFDRFARHALSWREMIEACVVGGSVVLGLPLFIIGLFSGNALLMIPGLTLVGMAFPFAHTFTNPSKIGTIFFGTCGLYILAAGAGVLVYEIVKWKALGLVVGPASALALLVVVAVTWLANVPMLKRK